MRWSNFPLLPLLVLCLPTCTIAVPDIPPPPDRPTYNHDVRPYLADHCLVCHSSPSDNGAPKNFRFDIFEDTEGGNVLGAQSMADGMVGSTVKSDPRQMPPGGGLGPNGKQLLINWFAENPPLKD